MAKRTRISALICRNLMKQLKYEGYLDSGRLARVLLEGFVFDDGVFSADTFYQFIPKNTFSKLREKLKIDRFISFTDNSVLKRQYYPGHRIMPFVLQVKKDSFATITYVEERMAPVVDDVAALTARISKIEATVEELRSAMEPPDTPEKRQIAKLAVQKLQKLTKAAQN